MKLGTTVRRFLVPAPYVTLRCLLRFRAFVSPRAEVEFTDSLQLGRGTVVGSFSKVKAEQGILRTGKGVRIANGCFLDAHGGGLTIGDHVLIGANCVISAVVYRFSAMGVPLEEQGKTSQGIVIGSNVFIGSNSVILDGSQLGDDVIVTPGSVVSGRFPAGTVLSGNPAKRIFQRRA